MRDGDRLFASSPLLLLLIIAALTDGCHTSSSVAVTAPSSDARCAMSLSAGPSTMSASGGNGTVAVSVSRECSWSAKSGADWIVLGSSVNGQGDGSVPYTVAANSVVSPRDGQILVNGEAVDVQQAAAPCTYVLDRHDQN